MDLYDNTDLIYNEYIKNNFISKVKIIDKIEELESVLDMLKLEKVARYKIRLIEEEIIDLQELLEE